MTISTNNIQNNALAAMSQMAPRNVMSAIKNASAKTGVNFAYMVQQASAESGFDASAKAKTSSASGLYQFIESTWLSMVERHGHKHGIETQGKSRREILELRNDPKTASVMAAEFASDNEKFLDAHWAKGEKKIGSTELYLAHFLGAGQAASFLNARDENPLQQAALIFPKAAKANRNVFYDTQTGRPKTMNEIHSFFDKKFKIKTADIPPEQSSNTNHVFRMTGGNIREFGSFTRSYAPLPYRQLISSPIEIMMLSQLDLPPGNTGNNSNNDDNDNGWF